MRESIEITAIGKRWKFTRTGNLESIWNSIDNGKLREDDIPYWVEIWPSSIALAEWVKINSKYTINKYCLDLGCGLGLATMIGALYGGTVIGVDSQYEALSHAKYSAKINNVPYIKWINMDWRDIAFKEKSIDIIWGADIVYEERFVKMLLRFFMYSLRHRGQIWLADQGRASMHKLLHELRKNKFKCKRVYSKYINRQRYMQSNGKVDIWRVVNGI